MGAVVGGTVAGVAAFSIALALFVCLRRRGRPPRTDSETEKIDTEQQVYVSFDQSQTTDPSNTPPFDTTTPVMVPFNTPPLDRFPPQIQDDARGNGHLLYHTMMDVSPPAATRFVQPPISAPFPVPITTHDAPPPAMHVPSPTSLPIAPPPALLRDSQALSTTETTDADTDAVSIPGSISSSSMSPLLASRFGRPLRDDEVRTIADLILQGIPPADAARILERMQREGDGATSIGHATMSTSATTGAAWSEKMPVSEGSEGAAAAPAEPLVGPCHGQNTGTLPPPYQKDD